MLVRKIDKAKWISKDCVIEPPSADALTKDLTTSKNTLSVWHIDSETELEEAVLAITSGQPHSLETIDVIMLEDAYFVNCKIKAEETDGITPVTDLIRKHRDVSSLDFWTLGLVAEHIVENIKKKKIRRYRKADLKRIILDAIDRNRLSLDDLSESVRNQLL